MFRSVLKVTHYVFTTNKLCVNIRTGRVIKKVYNSGCLGYNIQGKFYSLTFLRANLTKFKSTLQLWQK